MQGAAGAALLIAPELALSGYGRGTAFNREAQPLNGNMGAGAGRSGSPAWHLRLRRITRGCGR